MNVFEENARKTGVPISHCTPSNGQKNGQQFNIHAAFVLLCPLREALKGTLFFSSETHLKQFDSSAISSLADSEQKQPTSQYFLRLLLTRSIN